MPALAMLARLMDRDKGYVVLHECRTAMTPSGILALQAIADVLQVPVVGTTGDYGTKSGFEKGRVVVFPGGTVIRLP